MDEIKVVLDIGQLEAWKARFANEYKRMIEDAYPDARVNVRYYNQKFPMGDVININGSTTNPAYENDRKTIANLAAELVNTMICTGCMGCKTTSDPRQRQLIESND